MKQFRSLMTRAWLLLAALFVLQSGAASADFPAPDVLVKSTSEEVLRFVADDKDLRNGSSSRWLGTAPARNCSRNRSNHTRSCAALRSSSTSPAAVSNKA